MREACFSAINEEDDAKGSFQWNSEDFINA